VSFLQYHSEKESTVSFSVMFFRFKVTSCILVLFLSNKHGQLRWLLELPQLAQLYIRNLTKMMGV
jgi:hypothetical protein